MGSKKAPPPDPNIGIAQANLADTARLAEQRANANDTYFRENFAPRYLDQMDEQLAMGRDQYDFSRGLAEKYDQRYWDTTAKQQDAFYAAVDKYDTGAERDKIAGRAMADVEQASAAGNQSLQRGLARRGVNPGSAAYLSMMGDQQRQTSLAKAGAATMAQEAARREGMNLRAAAAGLGGNLTGASQGYNAQANQAAPMGMQGVNAAAAGIGANNAQWNSTMGLGANAWGTMGNLGVQSYNAQVNAASGGGSGWGALASGMGSFAQGIGAAGGWSNFWSSKELKHQGAPLDGDAVLQKYKGMPVEHWQYKQGAGDGSAHVGPYAEDVQRRFGDRAAPGGKMINMGEMESNNGKAIGALTRKLEMMEREIARMGG